MAEQERSIVIRRLRQELNDALRYAQNAAEQLTRCEAELAEAKRAQAANRLAYEIRIAELQRRINQLEGRE